MDVDKAIDALKQKLPQGQFALRGTEAYEELSRSPKTVEEVSIFVRTIRPFALRGEAPFAIFGAGQQPAIGCNNIQDGITLNLSLLKGIEVKDGVVEIAAGERWGSIYKKLDPLGLSVAGGRSSRNGIGGLALQGGLSFFSSREGFISDNVVNYEIVLASGDVVNANQKDHPDLWKALKGGGNNFGVVTRFDLKTFKQGGLYGGSVVYYGKDFPSQIKALIHELQRPDATPETHLMVSGGFMAQAGPTTLCQNQVYYTQPVPDPEVLKPFTSIKDQIDEKNTIRLIPDVTKAADEQARDQHVSRRVAYMNLTVKADVRTLEAAFEIYQTCLKDVLTSKGLICSFTLQPYARSLLQKSATQGDNVLGLDQKDPTSLVNILLLTYWSDAGDDGAILGAMKSAVDKMRNDATKKETFVDYVYMNYASEDQDVISSYGDENMKFLQKTSKEYDPEGLFQKGVPGGWKLFT
ncbi:FAD-binding domain-containing protein [Xylariaceae sp. FL0594]|nr:FAD-binding domain-containing protein [Xylariaceae sp. FL0594]